MPRALVTRVPERSTGYACAQPSCLADCTRLTLQLALLFAVEAERLDHRTVADREEDRVLAAAILVRVLRPARQRDDVAFRPVEGLAVDDGPALAAHDMEHRASRDAPGLQLLALAQELDAAGNGRRHRSAGLRLRGFERDAFVGRSFGGAQGLQRLQGPVAGIEHQRREARP